MFIRTQTHRRKNGQDRRGFALVESRRVNGKSRNITLLNLGQEFDLPETQWADFTAQVEANLKGASDLPFHGEHFERWVNDTVKRLLDKGYDVHYQPNQRHLIIPDEISHPGSRTVGGERLALHALRLLGFPELLYDLGFSAKQVKLACAMIVGRMLSPGSERHTHDWMLNTSSILGLLGLEPPSLSALYRCSDRLNKHRHAVLDHLFGNTKALLQFDETIVFYDLTNTFYHGQQKGALLRRGRSKQKRNDCPLVTLALTLDFSGFPRNVEILPGNAGEPGTLRQAIARLGGTRPTVIMDAGIATKDNLAYLGSRGLDWIVVERTQAPPVPERIPEEQFETASGVKIKVWELTEAEEDGEADGEVEENGAVGADEKGAADEERRIYVHSEAKQATEDAMLEGQGERFLAALAKLHAGLSKRGYLKNYEKVLRKVGRLTEKYKTVARLYEVEVTKKDGTQQAGSVTVTRLDSHARRIRASGAYVLRSSRTDMELEALARTYWRLTEIESTFRVMKSDLGLRPIYHSKDERIEGHLFITVLAYHTAHLVRVKLKQDGIHKSWDTIRTRLNRIKRITSRIPKTRTRYLITNVDEELTPFLERIFHCLGLKYDPKATKTMAEHVEKPPSSHPPDP
jgi:transposase